MMHTFVCDVNSCLCCAPVDRIKSSSTNKRSLMSTILLANVREKPNPRNCAALHSVISISKKHACDKTNNLIIEHHDNQHNWFLMCAPAFSYCALCLRLIVLELLFDPNFSAKFSAQSMVSLSDKSSSVVFK